MLKLQEFLNAHPNDYEEILTQKPYCLKIKHKDTRVLFKYDQVESDFHEPIVCESRGIILEEGTWKVLRLAFYKFFNQGESLAADIDWDSADANEGGVGGRPAASQRDPRGPEVGGRAQFGSQSTTFQLFASDAQTYWNSH